jgi:hypothetical protein
MNYMALLFLLVSALILITYIKTKQVSTEQKDALHKNIILSKEFNDILIDTPKYHDEYISKYDTTLQTNSPRIHTTLYDLRPRC